MKKKILAIICIALCLALCGCVAKKEFDIETGTVKYENMFPWRGYTISVQNIVDDGSITSGSYTPQGRLVQIELECADGVMTWDAISEGYMDFSIRDASGNEYTPVSTGFSVAVGASLNIQDLENNDYVGLAPTFDIPEDADVTGFTLYVKTDAEGESITVPLKDIGIQQ